MTVSIDGAPFGATGTLLDAILAAGIHLPHLCKDDNLPAIGACRTCLVEADGRIVAACSTPAASVRDVTTTGERPARIRRGLELTADAPGYDGDGGRRWCDGEAIDRVG
jgi:predicted molibdopterin-dependent oxidoreductase YjgC